MMGLRESVFSLCLAIISSAADPLKTLRASVGGNITLPDTVEEEGFLSYERNILAHVFEKKLLKIYAYNYKERLHWNQNTGHFILTGLQKNDSGIYTIDSKAGRIVFVDYKLMVYDSVPTPQVSVLNRSSESCSLNCSVDSAQEDVTLLWSKDLEILKNLSASSLSLTLFNQQDLNSSLQCVAKNPTGTKTVSVDVRTSCQLNRNVNTSSSTDSRHRLTIIIIIIIIITLIVYGLVLLLFVYIIRRFFHQKESTVGQTEVEYTEINIFTQGKISQEASKSGNSILTTLYYEPAVSCTLCGLRVTLTYS